MTDPCQCSGCLCEDHEWEPVGVFPLWDGAYFVESCTRCNTGAFSSTDPDRQDSYAAVIARLTELGCEPRSNL